MRVPAPQPWLWATGCKYIRAAEILLWKVVINCTGSVDISVKLITGLIMCFQKLLLVLPFKDCKSTFVARSSVLQTSKTSAHLKCFYAHQRSILCEVYRLLKQRRALGLYLCCRLNCKRWSSPGSSKRINGFHGGTNPSTAWQQSWLGNSSRHVLLSLWWHPTYCPFRGYFCFWATLTCDWLSYHYFRVLGLRGLLLMFYFYAGNERKASFPIRGSPQCKAFGVLFTSGNSRNARMKCWGSSTALSPTIKVSLPSVNVRNAWMPPAEVFLSRSSHCRCYLLLN